MNTVIQTPVRLSPLYDVTRQLGARFVEIGGWRLPDAYTGAEAEIAAVRAGCGLADVTAHGKLQIEGEAAAEALRATFGSAPEPIGAGTRVEPGHLYRLRRDQFYLSTPPGREGAALAGLQSVITANPWFVTVTDMTHGLADIRIVGPASTQVLSKLCGLDFGERAFPDLTAKASSLARTRQLIIRRDFGSLPAYTMIGDPSLAAYVWGVVLEAGREFGITPVGVGALRVLEAG